MLARILHVSNSTYRSLHGAGPSYRIFKELARGAAEYHVLGQSGSLSFATEREGNLYLHRAPAPSAKLFGITAYQAVYLVRRFSLDRVLCQDPVLGGIAALHTARLFRIPLMVELHTDVYFRYLTSENPVHSAIGKMACHVLCSSTLVRALDRTQATLLEGVGVEPGRMIEIPYRVDTRFFSPERIDRATTRSSGAHENHILVVSIGRFVEQKGYRELILAVRSVASSMPAIRLVIAGGGPLETKYRDLIGREGLDENVRLLPWTSHEGLRELLGAADLYVQPSVAGKGDWMPRTILEAMAMGLPVVASDVGGIREVVREGRTGMIVPAGDIERLSSTILELSRNAPLRRRLGQEGRRRASAVYAWDAVFQRYRDAVYSLDAG